MSITSTLKSRTTIAAAAAIVVAGAAAFSWTHEARAVANAAIGRAATQTVANAAAPGPVVAPDFTQIVNQSGPAVVNISVSGLTKVADEEPAGMAEIDPRDPMYEFFRRFMAPGGRMSPQPPRVMRGEGSGFIVSPDGLIVTNAHVVKGASNVTVKLTDRREFQAKVLGSDAKTDVAVLKIDARALPTVRIGSARDLQVGQTTATCPSSRPTSRSTPAIPAARSSTHAARWWASTRRSTAVLAATRACRSRFPWTWR
jgi:serine protease Do